ncbi:cysteine desulfurase family protein [Histidinibacterium aquaticum]|uniref:Cysteine desulfurase n=1 Tax=Histidinibacterium aquaticum TaxID=2613962 RepID=A0A5J5GMK9_9RHOB|nr:aminotransferase class V-fold PLP-dependent enzyme [Histidinibacterium aquaticum]KAA9009297.1 aminotransferase class V-fold PLP-dependent enzyme [Histidinibacterium aquaticum]
MTGRVYLDWNATSPLRPEARAAMAEAMDVVGNPSSVHAEGRAAKGLIERARGQLAEALGASSGADLVFVSGATEAAALALGGRELRGARIEHDAVHAWCDPVLPVATDGRVEVAEPEDATLQLANSETGVVQDLPQGLAVSDITQGFGRLPFAYGWAGVGMIFLSAHKFGGPKGAGLLVIPEGYDLSARSRGGGQEMGRRSGTENVIGIAGMAAAAEAAQRDLAAGTWDRVAEIRNILEKAIVAASPETIFVGNAARRLPNTSLMLTPGWKGETQVMAMDLAGFAVSAGSACSSGKVRENRVLAAMGYDRAEAGCAIRVSIGPDTTEDQVLAFAEAWSRARQKQRARAA